MAAAGETGALCPGCARMVEPQGARWLCATYRTAEARAECFFYVTLAGHPEWHIALATGRLLRAELLRHSWRADPAWREARARHYAARALMVRGMPTAPRLIELYATQALQWLQSHGQTGGDE